MTRSSDVLIEGTVWKISRLGDRKKMESSASRQPICSTAPEELLKSNLYVLLWNGSPAVRQLPKACSSPITSWAPRPISHQRRPYMQLLLRVSIACIHPEALRTCVHKNRFWATVICSQVEELQSHLLLLPF